MRLTREEIILVTGILLALVVGAVVKNYRESERVAAIERSLQQGKADAEPRDSRED